MRYYTIQNNSLLIANNEQALTRFYENVLPLPDDYIEGKYIVSDNKLVLNPNWETEQLAKVKEEKFNEALTKAYEYQQNGTVEYKNCVFEMSDTNRKNLSDTEEALKLMGETSTMWNDKDDNLIELTVEDIQYIRLNLILAEIQKLWIVKYPNYKTAINEAETIEEVQNIVISYEMED